MTWFDFKLGILCGYSVFLSEFCLNKSSFTLGLFFKESELVKLRKWKRRKLGFSWICVRGLHVNSIWTGREWIILVWLIVDPWSIAFYMIKTGTRRTMHVTLKYPPPLKIYTLSEFTILFTIKVIWINVLYIWYNSCSFTIVQFS